MAQNQRQLLEQTVDQVRTWDADERSPASLEYLFFELNQADQSRNTDLWGQLREALSASAELKRKDPARFFDRPGLARQGYWWWDPEAWVVESPTTQAS